MTEPSPALVKLHYVGTVQLLSRLSHQIKDDSELYIIEQAIRDCAGLYDGYEVVKVGPNHYALEPKQSTN